jgi:hypothetical protein
VYIEDQFPWKPLEQVKAGVEKGGGGSYKARDWWRE